VTVGGVANVAVFTPTDVVFSSDLMPVADSVYSLGNITNQWKELWVSGSTIYVGGIAIGASAGNLTVNGQQIVTTSPTGTLTGNNIVATGNITTSGNLSVTGNTAIGGNLSAAGNLSTTGDVIAGGNLLASNLVTSGNVTAVGDITSTAGNINAAGNVNAANFYATGNIVSTGNTTSDTVITDTITSPTGPLTLTVTDPNQSIILAPSGTGVIDVSGSTITNMAEPVASTDAATKLYVDSLAQGLQPKDPVKCTAPGDIAGITGFIVTYNNGAGGIGATLTISDPLLTLDGYTLVNGDRILIASQTNTAQNGVYVRTSSTVLTRSTDCDTVPELVGGSFVYVLNGTTYGGTGWTISEEPTVMGSTPIIWTQFTGGGTYTAGPGLTLTGTQLGLATTGVVAGTYGGGANLVTMTVNNVGRVTSIANAAIGPVPNLTVTNTLTTTNANITGTL
jgi:hypothetical protein